MVGIVKPLFGIAFIAIVLVVFLLGLPTNGFHKGLVKKETAADRYAQMLEEEKKKRDGMPIAPN